MSAQPTHSAPSVPFVAATDLFARHQTIAGLRALADFLEANPAVPVEEFGWTVSVYTRGLGEECGRAEVARIASVLGAALTDDTGRGGHLVASKAFGRITYQAVHIPTRYMTEHHARTSYHPNITLNTDPAPNPAPRPASGPVAEVT